MVIDTYLAHWLEKRVAHWQSVARRLRRPAQRGSDVAEAMQLVVQYRDLARDLSLARGVLPQGRLAAMLQSLFLAAHEELHRPPFFPRQQLLDLFLRDIPAVAARLRGVIAATFTLFIASALCGWLLVFNYPPLASLFASEQMIEMVRAGNLWTDNLLNVMPSSLLSLGIMTNNIVVAIFAFLLGSFYGLGTLYIIGMNGLMLGAIFAFTGEYGLAGGLFKFVVAHGVVELSVICLAGAAGVSLGEALLRPGDRGRGQAFQEAVQQGGKLLLLCALFLIGAGLIEGFVSPDDRIPLVARVVIGLGYGVLLYLAVSGRWRRLLRAPAQQ